MRSTIRRRVATWAAAAAQAWREAWCARHGHRPAPGVIRFDGYHPCDRCRRLYDVGTGQPWVP